jgi:BirA family biotin operon repressor/biotin-[acetyl-CoA-carboxylase] ligase
MSQSYRQIHFEEIGSTNDEAIRLIKEADTADLYSLVITADSQTAGRGRSGKSFATLRGNSIYMSIIRKAPESLHAAGFGYITMAVAVAVHETLQRFLEPHDARELGIKWVNDILLRGRKVCGILVESLNGAVVIGIGINVNVPKDEAAKHGGDVASRAGSVYLPERKIAEFRHELIQAVIQHYTAVMVGTEDALRTLVDDYRTREVTCGSPVTVTRAGEAPRAAAAIAIEDDGGLRVRFEDGEEEVLIAGEVSLSGVGA